ncbi:glyoxylase-like metal-dependent hydrolase (beta-lactamase superfamily II) [Jatrophihabitans sp. GAS493]|uniref:MBL fold metallo-hydrolase n=1 Tax=Jatrophihabitans sp. GAS493 TaxID=1907575 RepID=UPI000BBFC67F|nr:MBL fold metallo-hydrolase [Jatrophihabitans sp. GAS493]SOD71889.1 glyoxylase-like metal-dependent hydrolase (beta-lactamase superfamily II) [Jatrophihabitans sp. GAS493]
MSEGGAAGAATDGSDQFAYETPRQVTDLASVVLARNPHPMTLEGTNTWILRAPGESSAIVVDPGPEEEQHLAAVQAAAGRVAVILLTHGHIDHSAGARRLHEMTGAAVRCLDPAFRFGGSGLQEGDVVAAAGIEVRVWGTPGHTSDSLSFLLEPGSPAARDTPSAAAAVLTGDTILGRGTTVVAYPDGDLGQYLTSLRRLEQLGPATVLPGHGPELAEAGVVAGMYLAHRQARLGQVDAALSELTAVAGSPVTARQIVERVYRDVDQALWPAAELSVEAQLHYLRAGRD